MKIAIITLPLRHNYGGILQNYALQRVLCQMGHDVTTLEITKTEGLDIKAKIVLFIRNLFYKCVDKQGRFLHIWSGLTTEQRLSANTWKFIANHIKVRRIIGYPNETEYDAYVVGSDQVWRPKYFDPDIAFLTFTMSFGRVKRIAYAASFGTENWEYDDALTKKCSFLVSRFDAISVREKLGIQFCREHFSVEANHVLDPTMLLSRGDYLQSLDVKAADINKGIFYYFLDENEWKRTLLKRITLEKGGACFTVNSKVENSKAAFKDRIQPPVEDWIRAFEECSFVVTDSFHGTVFSLIFNKPFIVVGNLDRGLSRFISVLGLFNQEFRLIKESSVDNIDFSIYWDRPNVSVELMRYQSLDFLKNNL